MSKKLFVGGLSWNTTDTILRQAFERFGPVTEAKVVLDRETGRSRGFAFVDMASEDDAKAAIAALDGVELEGRPLRVNEATDRPERPGGGPGGPRPPRR